MYSFIPAFLCRHPCPSSPGLGLTDAKFETTNPSSSFNFLSSWGARRFRKCRYPSIALDLGLSFLSILTRPTYSFLPRLYDDDDDELHVSLPCPVCTSSTPPNLQRYLSCQQFRLSMHSAVFFYVLFVNGFLFWESVAHRFLSAFIEQNHF